MDLISTKHGSLPVSVLPIQTIVLSISRLAFLLLPSSNKIQKRIENLESEQAATVREKQKLQKKQKTLDIIQQNFSVLLDAPEINSDLLPAKREPVSVTRDK